MKKFSFINSNEKAACIDAIQRYAPLHLVSALSRFAQGLPAQKPTVPLAQPDDQWSVPGPEYSAAEEHINELRETLREFLVKANLTSSPQAFQWIEAVIAKIKPAVEQAMQGQDSLDEQLAQVPYLSETERLKQQVQTLRPDLAMPRSPEADSHLMEFQHPPKAPVLPKNQKLSPTQKSPLFRKKPPLSTERPASVDWGEKRESAMKDEQFDKIVSAMLEIADLADEAAMYKEADAIASILPSIRTVKVAQYEGFQNYWIANGRAFEMAYKQKRSKGKNDPEDFRSPHEVWFEILEEYQKSLLTNQADFIAKYANKNFTGTDRSASDLLMRRISLRVQKGSSPGVALYESIDELGSGKHAEIVASATKSALTIIAEAARKNGKEDLAVKAESLAKEAQGWFGKVMRGLGFDYGNPTATLSKRINEGEKAQMIGRLTKLYNAAKQAEAAGTPLSSAQLHDAIGPLYDGVGEFIDRAKLIGMRGVPDLPDLSMAMEGDAVKADGLAKFTNLMDAAMKYVRPETGQQIDKYLYQRFPEGLTMPASTYLEYFRGGNPPAGGAKTQPPAPTPPTPTPTPTPQPTPPAPTPQPKDAKTSVASFENNFKSLKPDQQFEALAALIKLSEAWGVSPEGMAEMGRRGTDPSGAKYTASTATPTPVVKPNP